MKQLLVTLAACLIGCGSPLAIDRSLLLENLATAEKPAAEWTKLIVLDIGQGDAAVLIAPSGETALIDTGPPERGAAAVLEVLVEQAVERVAYLIISHHHADHEGSLPALRNHSIFSQTQMIDPESAQVGATMHLGDVSIRTLGANGQMGDALFASDDPNALSVALFIEYGAFTYLTAGDLTGGGGNPPYQTIDLETPLAELAGDVDILHVNHHGSHTSTNQNLLDGVTPEAAVISVGDQNDFFHPHPSVINRLLAARVSIYQTERGWLTDEEAGAVTIINGHLCILTNGETYQIEPYAEDKCNI